MLPIAGSRSSGHSAIGGGFLKGFPAPQSLELIRRWAGDFLMMATAAVTATASAAVEIALFRHTAQFEGLADVLRDGLLHFLHVLLRIQEDAGDRVLQERLPQVLEIGDLA